MGTGSPQAPSQPCHRANRVNIRAGGLSFYILSESSGVPYAPRSHAFAAYVGGATMQGSPLIRALFDHTSNLRFHRKKTRLWQLSRFPFCEVLLHHLVFYSYFLSILYNHHFIGLFEKCDDINVRNKIQRKYQPLENKNRARSRQKQPRADKN